MDIDHDLGKIYNNVTTIDPGTGKLIISGATGVQLPSGTTADRPTPSDGVIRRNSETGYVEVYSNSQWVNIRDYSLSGLPAGGATNNVLIKTSATDYDAHWGIISADMAPYAKQLVAFVRNDDTVTLPKGTPVYQIGSVGNSWTIAVAAADAADPAKMPAIGILAQDLAPSITGDMIVLGEIRDVNTSGFNEGDLVYVAPGGGYTSTKPTNINYAIQFLGIVTKIHATNGGGYITGTGTLDLFRSDLPGGGFYGWNGTQWVSLPDALGEIGDVSLSNLQTGQYLSYNGTSWVNVTGTAAATSHAILSERSSPDQHPISAITNLQTTLDAKALKGDNTDITSLSGITGGISTADYIDFDTINTITPTVGRLSWNKDDLTLNLGLNSDVTLQIGQEQVIRVYNNGVTTLLNGKAVYVTGSNNGDILVSYAIANTEDYSKTIMGILTQDILPGGYGFCTISGLVRNINTNDLAQGEPIYLSATTAGGLTSTLPSAPNHKTRLGYCITQSATVGIIYVKVINDYEMGEITDVNITTPHTNNEFLVWNDTNKYWENKSTSSVETILGVDQKAPLSHTHSLSNITQSGATTSQVATWNGTSWVAADHYVPTPTEVGTLATADILPYVSTVYKDACGFPNRTDTSISFNKTTRVFTLTPLNANACVYYFGTKYTISSPLTITWSDADGGRYISFDPSTQTLVESFSSPDIKGGQILVAYVYWNATNDYMIIGGDERHSSSRDTQWHSTQHRDVGAVWRSGGTLTFTLDDPSAVTIGVSTPIMFADEDIDHSIAHTATPNYPTLQYAQILNTAAWLPVVAYIGTTYMEYPATGTLPWKVGTTRAQYNLITTGSGSLADATNNTYINYWLVATNDGEFPVKLIMGRTLYPTEEDAMAEVLSQYGLPFAEMAVMYRITLHVNDTYTQNAAHVTIANIVNAYRTTTGGITAISATSHDALSNRNLPDQHPIGAITNLQTSLDSKQPTLISGTNIKTINNASILTSGNLDLQPALVSGTSIKTVAGFSLLGSGNQPLSLDDLSDVLLTTPTAGQAIIYNGTQWVNLGQTGAANGGGAAKRIWSNNIAASTGTSVITPGVTAPLVTAGTQVWTVTITPYSTAATYVIQSNITVASSVNNANLTLALFRDSTYIGGTLQIVSSGTNSSTLSFSITDLPNTTSPVTYQVRVGTSTGTWYVNRRSSEITYGGYQTGWVMWEY